MLWPVFSKPITVHMGHSMSTNRDLLTTGKVSPYARRKHCELEDLMFVDYRHFSYEGSIRFIRRLNKEMQDRKYLRIEANYEQQRGRWWELIYFE